jgi:hypothetical protein
MSVDEVREAMGKGGGDIIFAGTLLEQAAGDVDRLPAGGDYVVNGTDRDEELDVSGNSSAGLPGTVQKPSTHELEILRQFGVRSDRGLDGLMQNGAVAHGLLLLGETGGIIASGSAIDASHYREGEGYARCRPT